MFYGSCRQPLLSIEYWGINHQTKQLLNSRNFFYNIAIYCDIFSHENRGGVIAQKVMKTYSRFETLSDKSQCYQRDSATCVHAFCQA